MLQRKISGFSPISVYPNDKNNGGTKRAISCSPAPKVRQREGDDLAGLLTL